MIARLLLALFSLLAVLGAQPLRQYAPGPRVAGKIRIWGHGAAGHDYIETLVRKWEDGFLRFQPGVVFESKLAGTASAIGALYTGTGELALLGREIWPSEIAAFREVFHYDPTEVDVVTGSYNVRNKDFALNVYVHKDNPLSRLTLAQVEEVFSCCTRRDRRPMRAWGELGLKDAWAGRPVRVYGFEISRGFGYYMQQVVFGGGFLWNPNLVEFADQRLPDGKLVDAGKRVLDALAQDPDGIAYSSALYENPAVKPLALARAEAGPYVLPTPDTVQSRSYPLTRVIPIFLNRAPGKPVDASLKEFLRYILSREGQAAVAEDGGYLPLTAALAEAQLRLIE
jgi:phosphate transport system substrate-binding protein